MSCGCTNTCGCSNCVAAPASCCTPTTESVTYTFENANISGVGFFDNETNYLVQFRGLVSNSLALTVSLNAPDKVIELDFDSALLVADIPDATTAVRGILETATDAEALAKAANNKIVTPSNFAAMGATTTFAGFAELSTDAEALAGVSSSVVLTPANLQYVFDNGTTAQAVFADAATRGGQTPTFIGQVGGQQDNGTLWIGTALVAGSWSQALTDGTTLTLTNPTVVDTSGSSMLFNGGVTFSVGSASFDNSTVAITNGSTFAVTNTSFIDIATANGQLSFNSVNVAANQVLITGAAAGLLTVAGINTFLSSANVQTGYTTFTNPVTRRTCDTTTVTLPELAQIVGTLIEDLKSVLLPSA